MSDAQSRRLERERLHAHGLREDLRAVMSTPQGRRYLWWLLDGLADMESGTFTGEALSSAYAEGRRSVGRDVKTELQRHAPEAFLLMLQEELEARLAQPQEPVNDESD